MKEGNFLSDHLQSDEEKITHEYSKRIVDLKIRKHLELLEAINNKNKFKWPVFLSSLFFIIFISIILTLSHRENQNVFINLVVVNFGFNFIFTYAFSQALVYSMGYPYLKNINNDYENNDEIFYQNIKLFNYSALIGIALSAVTSQLLYYLWIKGEYISSILDSTLLAFIFMHMIKGLSAKYTSRQLIKIREKYNKEILLVINEYDNLRDIIDEKLVKREGSIKLEK